jgi:hypothetical protein
MDGPTLGFSQQTHPLGIDPILCDFPLPLRSVFFPLGFPVEIFTNSAEVQMAARAAWQGFSQKFPVDPVEMRICVSDSNNANHCPAPICRGQRNLVLMIGDNENFGAVDVGYGFAFGWFTNCTVQRKSFFRYHFLEALTLVLLMGQHLTPIHAACVGRNGKGILLCGDQGAGKSSLAYACAQRGWTFVTDDGSSLVRSHPDRVVVGNPHRIRFRESGIELFPELMHENLTPQVNGELAIELATMTRPEIVQAQSMPVEHILFLNRQESGPPSLSPFPIQQALSWLEQMIVYGEPALRAEQRASLEELLMLGAHEFKYSNLEQGVDRLTALIDHGI